LTVSFEGAAGRVSHVRTVKVGPGPDYEPVAGSDERIPADLALVAIGFARVERDGAVEQLSVGLDDRGNVAAPAHATSVDGVFATGDARIGQSLVVTAIADGRECARVVDEYLLQGEARARQSTATYHGQGAP
jgi:glutamate synthase (NADPH/NADH) small chain